MAGRQLAARAQRDQLEERGHPVLARHLLHEGVEPVAGEPGQRARGQRDVAGRAGLLDALQPHQLERRLLARQAADFVPPAIVGQQSGDDRILAQRGGKAGQPVARPQASQRRAQREIDALLAAADQRQRDKAIDLRRRGANRPAEAHKAGRSSRCQGAVEARAAQHARLEGDAHADQRDRGAAAGQPRQQRRGRAAGQAATARGHRLDEVIECARVAGGVEHGHQVIDEVASGRRQRPRRAHRILQVGLHHLRRAAALAVEEPAQVGSRRGQQQLGKLGGGQVIQRVEVEGEREGLRWPRTARGEVGAVRIGAQVAAEIGGGAGHLLGQRRPSDLGAWMKERVREAAGRIACGGAQGVERGHPHRLVVVLEARDDGADAGDAAHAGQRAQRCRPHRGVGVARERLDRAQIGRAAIEGPVGEREQVGRRRVPRGQSPPELEIAHEEACCSAAG